MRILLLCTLTILLALSACRKDEQISTDSSFLLEFSRDTVIFDTVFTTVGSATQALKVYNRGAQAVEVGSIYLGKGESSSYRMNVDGVPGSSISDVFIPGNDSIFIFLEVTIDPNDVNSPLIDTDSLVFNINGNSQHVDLVAWGQDARFYYPTDYDPGLPPYTCLDGDCNGISETFTWTNEKPIVIYGYIILYRNDLLNIEPGTQIYLHEGSGIWVWEDGQIQAIGTADQKIVFQHDRQEMLYDDIPGQWDLIRINEGQAGNDNELTHVIIKNSIIGLEAKPLTLQEEDLFKPNSDNKLILNNCIIQQNTAYSLLARKYQIEAKNCLFANAGQNVCGIYGGGDYKFTGCTFGNYWIYSNRTQPAFYMSDQYRNELGQSDQFPIQGFNAANCIMYGNTFNEFQVELGPTQDSTVINFRYSLVRYDASSSTPMSIDSEELYSNMYENPGFQGPGFVAPSDGDFHLIVDPFVKDLGDPGLIGDDDLDGPFRDGLHDLGCYEGPPD